MAEPNTLKFRESYRAGISPWYNGYVHVIAVFATGFLALGWMFSQVQEASVVEWLTLPLTLIIWNFIEYFVHKQLGHKKRKLARLFYKRHSGDHHTFYTDQYFTPANARDWRVTFFPVWLIFVVLCIAGLWFKGLSVITGSANIGWVSAIGLVAGYLLYETIHYCDHLPQDHFIAKLPWLGHMRHLHRLHHRRDLMHSKNFNLTFPLADWVLGTFYWEAGQDLACELGEDAN